MLARDVALVRLTGAPMHFLSTCPPPVRWS